MDICDAIEDADNNDAHIPAERALAQIKDIESASLQMQQDLQYPVSPPMPGNPDGYVMFLNYMHPDVLPTVVHQLIRRGWRRDESKALIKPRKVIGSQFADLVAYVPLDQPDDPIVVQAPKPDDPWSVRPAVNVIDEKRPE